MAYCDVCENFDWEHVDGDPEVVANMTDEGKRNFQPDLYYYWDGDFCSEDYDWRDAFPNVDCMCVKYVSTSPIQKASSNGCANNQTVH